MKKKFKTILKVASVMLFTGIISGCTANFCSVKDKGRMMYAYDSGLKENGEYNANFTKIIEAAEKKGYDEGSLLFWEEIDVKVETAIQEAALTGNHQNYEIHEYYGYLKFTGEKINSKGKASDALWVNWDSWYLEIKNSQFTIVQEGQNVVLPGTSIVPNADFVKFYKSQMEAFAAKNRSCITPTSGKYDGKEGTIIIIEGKTWGDAFNKGIIEGLLVYPISWLLNSISNGFGNGGWGQVLAILFVTLIVRGLLMAATFKSTMAQQKMTALQPELAKIQSKYPNSNTNRAEKERLAQEQMALYKRNKINPFAQIFVMLLQFPIFIAVWGAMNGSAILASDSVWGLNLAATLGSEMLKFNAVAIVLFVLMSVAQWASTKMPQWMQKAAVKKVAKLGKNEAQEKQNKQMKMISNIMLIMIIVMGFSLPSAMGVYWLIGALISIGQTYITQTIMRRKRRNA